MNEILRTLAAPPTAPQQASSPAAENVLTGGGDMGALMRSMDWAGTSLGPIEAWPQSLKTAVSICLASRFPILIWWGPGLVMLYNDAYRPMLGATKHPQAMGAPGREIWPEIWDIIGPMLAGVLERGEATWSDDQMLPLHRRGYTEECYFTFSYSPIRDETGGVGGIFTAVTETTDRVLGERRLAALRELAARTVEAKTAEDACRLAAGVLAANNTDLPYALLYLLDGNGSQARLAGVTGLEADSPASPEIVDLAGGQASAASADPWQLARAVRSGPVELHDVQLRFGNLPGGPWPESSHTALVLPIAQAGQPQPAGLLVAGVSPRRALDDAYRDFLGLVAGQIATAVADARAYEAERQRAEHLAELDRAKTAFFSNVSHEFRTPLTLLLGPLEDVLAAGDAVLPPEQREQLTVAHRNSLRLLRLVNSLLDFSRIEAGRVQAAYELTDVAAYTAELASLFRSATERAGLRLVVDTPPLPAGMEVYVDHGMWEKVVLNLLSNAFKHTFEGEIAVSLRAAADGGAVELQVRDTGIGIPAEELPRLFERFHRVQGAQARTHEGTGIGLALVQELVKLHGGTVAVVSTVGSGTTFTVTLPTGQAHLPPDRIGASRDTVLATDATAFVEEALRWLPEDSSAGSGPGLDLTPWAPQPMPTNADSQSPSHSRVLVADDNADMRDYVTRLLRRSYIVQAVADGEAALAAAREQPPDLVLADVMMPRLDGFGLLHALRADPRLCELPVLLLSARAGEEATVEGLAAGADDYLTKPFTARELLARIEAQLSLARLRRDVRQQIEVERARLHELFLHAPAAICLLSGPDHVYTLTNPRYLELIGRQESDVLGKAVRQVFPELEEQGILDLLDSVYETGQAFVGNELLVRLDRDGDGVPEDVYVNFVYAPRYGLDGRTEGIFVHAYEVTDQVQARQEAESAVKARDEFLSIASHELRTPVATLKGSAQLLQRRQARGELAPERVAHTMATISATADRLGRLIDDLLDVSRLHTGQLALAREPADLVSLVQQAVARAEDLAAGSHQVALQTPTALPVLALDVGRMEQVLTNVLGNAIKYSPSGGVVQVALGEADGGVLLRVRDGGIGLSPGTEETIFEPFGRAPNAAASQLPGMGLGLYICRRIVERHGGRIWAASAGEGHGTTISVWLPYTTGEPPDEGRAE